MNIRTVRPLLVLVLAASASAQLPQAPALRQPDERYKADLLLVVAHPDDDFAVAAYLARAIFDAHKRVAVVYGTLGDGGPNEVGTETGRALGDVRQIEGRRALATFGITNVWFLGGHDTPGQDVLHPLETWHHGAVLENLVRLMRLTRPEVVLTMLPAYVVGENHDDHQAAAVLATEAFDLAADPLVFPEQLAVPRPWRGSGSPLYGSGLRPWQPKKLYFYDAVGLDDFGGHGPQYSMTDISPSKGVAYSTFRDEVWGQYTSQTGLTPEKSREFQRTRALSKTPVPPPPMPPERLKAASLEVLILGKSHVPASLTGDVFEGITAAPLPFIKPRGYVAPARSGVSLELGGPWAFYRDFWPAHNLSELETVVKQEASIGAGEVFWVPLVIRNDTPAPKQVTLRSLVPAGWVATATDRIYPVGPYEAYLVQLYFEVPKTFPQAWQELKLRGLWQALRWEAEADGTKLKPLELNVFVFPRGVHPQ